VAALIVVLSVMNGFQKELRTRILGVASHVQVSGVRRRAEPTGSGGRRCRKHPQVRAAAPYVKAQGMLSFDQTVRGALVRGVLPDAEDKVADFGPAHALRAPRCSCSPASFGIVLGAELARRCGVRGDKVTLIAPQGLVTPAASCRASSSSAWSASSSGHVRIRLQPGAGAPADAQTLYRMEDRCPACA
jgi:lipoprotein-releasing system permease protein